MTGCECPLLPCGHPVASAVRIDTVSPFQKDPQYRNKSRKGEAEKKTNAAVSRTRNLHASLGKPHSPPPVCQPSHHQAILILSVMLIAPLQDSSNLGCIHESVVLTPFSAVGVDFH